VDVHFERDTQLFPFQGDRGGGFFLIDELIPQPFHGMVQWNGFDFYAKRVFTGIVEETAPGAGVFGEDDRAFRRIVGDEQAVFTGRQWLSFDHHIVGEFDGGVLVSARSPGGGLAGAESLVDISDGNELAPNLSVASLDAGPIVVQCDIGNAYALGDGGFFISSAGGGGQLRMGKRWGTQNKRGQKEAGDQTFNHMDVFALVNEALLARQK